MFAFDVAALAAASAATLLLAEDDARLRQIVWRELYFDLIAWDDANEMLAHFARNMRENIPRAWKIDAKHRARQHLRYRSFGHDLSLLRHALRYRGSCFSQLARATRRNATAFILLSGPPRVYPLFRRFELNYSRSPFALDFVPQGAAERRYELRRRGFQLR
jgi:hypothetical protein